MTISGMQYVNSRMVHSRPLNLTGLFIKPKRSLVIVNVHNQVRENLGINAATSKAAPLKLYTGLLALQE
jgi:hypothetical protein